MEEKVRELEKRLEKLERKEKIRKSTLIIKISLVALLVIAIFIFCFILYTKVQNTLKPIREFIGQKDGVGDTINEGINSIKDFFNKN